MKSVVKITFKGVKSTMIRILDYTPQGKATVAISNTHGNAPSYEICEFCGQEAIKILMGKLQNNRSGRLYFEREGISYRLYGGPSRAKTIPGKYCFHVYKYSGK